MNVIEELRKKGIQPSAQRVAVAEYVLGTHEHPSADTVWNRVRGALPVISRATVYNTLHLFVEKGLLRQLSLSEGSVVYDANTDRHHHVIDEETGEIEDVPWDSVKVHGTPRVPGFEISDYQVVMRGKRRRRREIPGSRTPDSY